MCYFSDSLICSLHCSIYLSASLNELGLCIQVQCSKTILNYQTHICFHPTWCVLSLIGKGDLSIINKRAWRLERVAKKCQNKQSILFVQTSAARLICFWKPFFIITCRSSCLTMMTVTFHLHLFLATISILVNNHYIFMLSLQKQFLLTSWSTMRFVICQTYCFVFYFGFMGHNFPTLLDWLIN